MVHEWAEGALQERYIGYLQKAACEAVPAVGRVKMRERKEVDRLVRVDVN